MSTYLITPDGPFSLSAAGFGFGPRTGRPKPTAGEMRLAFVTDAHFYGLGRDPATRDQVEELSQRWRPFRTWAAVLLRVAGDRQGLPVAA